MHFREVPAMLKRVSIFLASLTILAAAVALAPSAGKPGAIPDYQPVANWPRLPEGFQFGEVTAVEADAADNLYVFHRGKGPVRVFDRDGKQLRTWGDDLIKNAHALRLDR